MKLKHCGPICKRGYTLIELMITMMVMALVLIVLVTAYLAIGNVFNTENNISGTSIEATRAMDTMEEEIRNSLGIQTANSTTLTYWWQDTNGDGTFEPTEIVTYSWDGTKGDSLIRTCNGTTETLAKGVSNFKLSYDSAVQSNITMVTIDLSVSAGTSVSTLESTINIRNNRQ